MTPSQSRRDPLAPDLTLAVLDEVLQRAVRPDADRKDWVEVLMEELPPDWRGQLMSDVTRASPLRSDRRTVLLRTDWERRVAILLEQAKVTLAYRDALLLAEAGPSDEELAQAPHLEPWRVIDLGRFGPCLEGRVTDPLPGGLEEIGPSLLMALGPGLTWARLLRGWIRLGQHEEGGHPTDAPGSGSEFAPRKLDQEETRAALRVLRRGVELMLKGLRPLGGVAAVRADGDAEGQNDGPSDPPSHDNGRVARRSPEQQVSEDEGEASVGRLLARVYSLFASDTGWWLRMPNPFLDNLSPLDCLATAEGRRRLDNCLTRFEAGFCI